MIVVLALALCGVLIGVSLGAVGAGGSILAVPVLVYVAGEHPRQATASALMVVLLTALMALRPHWTASRVRLDVAIPFAAAGVLGALAGKVASEHLNPDVLMLCFSGVMVTAAALMARRARGPIVEGGGDVPSTAGPSGSSVAVLTRPAVVRTTVNTRVLGSGVFVGLMTGFFGVGGGFVIVPALVLLLGLSMAEAVGTSLVIVAINSAVTFGLKSRGLSLDWGIIALFSASAAVGAFFGGRLSRRFDGRTLTTWFVRMVVVVAIYTAVRSGSALVR